MGDDIGSGLSSMAVCFDFCSTNVVQLSNRNPYFYRFRCHHPFITQLIVDYYFHFSVGGGSIVWKLSQWQPVERLLAGTASGRKMERSLQFELVDKLTQVCQRHRIDPDKLEELLATFDGSEPDPGEPASDFVDAILDFFSTHMKMQE